MSYTRTKTHLMCNRFAVGGHWTPSAEILCCSCYSCTIDNEYVYDREVNLYEAAAVCDKCGTQCWVRLDVAYDQFVCRLVNEAVGREATCMSQTGGGCAAGMTRESIDGKILMWCESDIEDIQYGSMSLYLMPVDGDGCEDATLLHCADPVLTAEFITAWLNAAATTPTYEYPV